MVYNKLENNNDGFIPVKSNKKNRKFNKTFGSKINKTLNEKMIERLDNIDEKFFSYTLDFAKKQLEYWQSKGYINEDNDSINVDIICYGIGSPTDSIASQHQLAFIYKLRQALKVNGKFEIFDPVEQSEEDLNIYTQWGLSLIPHNEESKRSIDQIPTIFYMPHCPKLLYNNVLGSNWNLNALDRLILIGNRFDLYDELNIDQSLKTNCPYLYNSLEWVKIDQFLPFTPDETIFNDTSFHRFQVALNPLISEFKFEPLETESKSDEEVISAKIEEKLNNLKL